MKSAVADGGIVNTLRVLNFLSSNILSKVVARTFILCSLCLYYTVTDKPFVKNKCPLRRAFRAIIYYGSLSSLSMSQCRQ